jgi:hypothetical protein
MGRAAREEVVRLPGVVAVIDEDAGRVAGAIGVPDDDVLEVVHHFCGTWDHLIDALTPVLADATGEPWAPGRWWSCRGGDRVAAGRAGRTVIAEAPALALLAAVAGDGSVDGVAVWSGE